MEEKRFEELLERYRSGRCTPGEMRILHKVFNRVPLVPSPDIPEAELLRLQRQALAEFQAQAGLPKPARSLARRLLPYAAAAVLLIASVAGWWAVSYRQSAVSVAANEILPGGNRATLTLADGRVVDLSSEHTGITVNDKDITYNDGLSSVVMLSADEPLRWGQEQGAAGPIKPSADMLALTTPKGGTYQITLPDGSKVWLNAGSTLTYPSRFSESERIVQLQGEAYFSVTGIVSHLEGGRGVKQPFKVQTAGQTVEVLGTQFNISAYHDDPETKTTLVEGKVQVGLSPLRSEAESRLGGRGGRERFLELKPGEQSITHEAAITVNNVDTYRYTAWKEGRFNFTGETLGGAMQQVGRWYDIEVVFTDEALRDARVSAIVGRDEKLSALLALFESAGDLRFQLSGRTLTVTKK